MFVPYNIFSSKPVFESPYFNTPPCHLDLDFTELTELQFLLFDLSIIPVEDGRPPVSTFLRWADPRQTVEIAWFAMS